MPTVKVSTKHPGGRWRTGRQFGPEEVEIEVDEAKLKALLADPVLRVVTLDGAPLPGTTAPTQGAPEKKGLESEAADPPGPTVPAGGPAEQSQHNQKRR